MSTSAEPALTSASGQTEMRSAHPSMVLGSYLERLVRSKRVAILGDTTIGLGEKLIERGARLVHAYDPDKARASEVFARTAHDRGRHVTVAPLEADLGVRDGAFDVVVVPDLSLFADGTAILRQARKLVGQTGVCVIASPNPDVHRRLLGKGASAAHAANAAPPSYYTLYDLVSLQFPIVRMLGQAPFVGYTIADFAAGPDLEVSVDTSLLHSTEEPEYFIAIASERRVVVDPFVVIEMALSEVREALGPSGLSPEALAALSDAESKAKAEAHASALEKATTEAKKAFEAKAIDAAAKLVELEAKLEKMREVDARAGDAHVRAERLTHQIRDLDEELRRQRDRATKLAKQLDDEKKARTKAELELGISRGTAEMPGAKERIAELSAEANAARARAMELEGELSAASLGIDELSADRAALKARVAELEVLLHEKAAAAKELDPVVVARLATLETAIEQAEQARRETEKKLVTLASVAEERDTLAAKNKALESRVAELLAQRAAVEANAPDIDALEDKLKERGQTIATLERDLRESLRVGKELVDELEALREAGQEPPQGAGSPPTQEGQREGQQGGPQGAAPMASASGESLEEAEALKAQLDTLAVRAARSEADLKASEWRIAQLEMALASAERPDLEPPSIAVELEQALLAAHQQLAALRKAEGPEGGHVASDVAAQAVLMHQLAAELQTQP